MSQECIAVGEAAQQAADSACAAELPANQPACYAQAQTVGLAAQTACAAAERTEACGPCAYCRSGYCQNYCPADCQICDPTTHSCRDVCPPDQYCSGAAGGSEQNGVCTPKCPSPCAPYDPITGGCHDECATNQCMVCKQGICQSNCPNKADFCDTDGTCKPCDSQNCRHIDPDGVCRGCDPNCERCENGTCVTTTCAAGEICCLGTCISCCGGTCDKIKGLGVNCGVYCGSDVCCPAGTHCCYDAPNPVGGGPLYNCCPDGQSCCPPYFARCGC